MTQPRRKIVFIAYNGAQVLDITGPYQVFASANEELPAPAYDLTLASLDGDMVRSSCGLSLQATPLVSVSPRGIDTLLVVGGNGADVRRAVAKEPTLKWIQEAATTTRRVGSVCTGTFLLAAAGLTDGRCVATHWKATGALARLYPDTRVDADALYVEDGLLWTSAGVTAGIDMALALVERDLGRSVAMRIARRLVVYAHRPGSQAQFSSLLKGQSKATGAFSRTLEWMQANMKDAITVTDAAEQAGMSERSFHRKFVLETGDTPARYLEKLRLEAARALLESPDLPLKAVAGESGFGTPVRLIQAFERTFGLSPTAYRKLHGVR
ncbi:MULTISPECIES: GlxA family transcriptional regulator [Kordiimonas]|jgi:transcriptional regulator GlxA family with amidase domain|uniref:GlxA family transcriptional regulator n=1 Tax=Kordiimonas TaxID=288021 RepID=UPI00257FC036|nr:GlxA family transcriptional regulator [Kordiimonas sp. UBA4487]